MTTHPTEAIEIKPCPFCGSADVRNARVSQDDADENCYVFCHGCHCEGSRHYTREQAIEAWNTRPTPPHSGADIVSKIREALDKAHDCVVGHYAPPHQLIASGIIQAYQDELIPQLEAMLAKEPVSADLDTLRTVLNYCADGLDRGEKAYKLLKPLIARMEQNTGGDAFPLGAIENGRMFIERLNAGIAQDDSDMQELIKCFEYMAEYLLNSRAHFNAAPVGSMAVTSAPAASDVDELVAKIENYGQFCGGCGIPPYILVKDAIAAIRAHFNAAAGEKKE